jgi:hypothetical protein
MLPMPKSEKLVLELVIVSLLAHLQSYLLYIFLISTSDILDSITIIKSKNVGFFNNVLPLKNK